MNDLKQEYIIPSAELVVFKTEDVITTSTGQEVVETPEE